MMKLLMPQPRCLAGPIVSGHAEDRAGSRRVRLRRAAFNLPFGRAPRVEAPPLDAAAAVCGIITQMGGSLDQEFAASEICRALWAGRDGRIAGRPAVL
jgi:hypothetical protein